MDANPLNILLVEDNPVNIELMNLMINRIGHQITVARNGQQALDKVKEKQFDLILMDIMMPVMDGLEATLAIRKFQEKINMYTPILALTASSMDNESEYCLENQLDGCINKPIRLDKLMQVLAQFSR